MPFTWSPKDPDEIYEYTHDWSKRLLVDPGDGIPVDVGDTLVLPDDLDLTKRPTIVSENPQPSDVEVTEIVNIPGTAKLQYWTAGGTAKTKFEATVRTAQGRIYQESFVLPVKER
jgi:hypothetical protein